MKPERIDALVNDLWPESGVIYPVDAKIMIEQALREEREAIADWLESQKTEDSGGIENVANFIYQSLANELREEQRTGSG